MAEEFIDEQFDRDENIDEEDEPIGGSEKDNKPTNNLSTFQNWWDRFTVGLNSDVVYFSTLGDEFFNSLKTEMQKSSSNLKGGDHNKILERNLTLELLTPYEKWMLGNQLRCSLEDSEEAEYSHPFVYYSCCAVLISYVVFTFYWMFLWSVTNGAAVFTEWATNFSLATIQDFAVIQVLKVLFFYGIALTMVKPKVEEIQVYLNDEVKYSIPRLERTRSVKLKRSKQKRAWWMRLLHALVFFAPVMMYMPLGIIIDMYFSTLFFAVLICHAFAVLYIPYYYIVAMYMMIIIATTVYYYRDTLLNCFPSSSTVNSSPQQGIEDDDEEKQQEQIEQIESNVNDNEIMEEAEEEEDGNNNNNNAEEEDKRSEEDGAEPICPAELHYSSTAENSVVMDGIIAVSIQQQNPSEK